MTSTVSKVFVGGSRSDASGSVTGVLRNCCCCHGRTLTHRLALRDVTPNSGLYHSRHDAPEPFFQRAHSVRRHAALLPALLHQSESDALPVKEVESLGIIFVVHCSRKLG